MALDDVLQEIERLFPSEGCETNHNTRHTYEECDSTESVRSRGENIGWEVQVEQSLVIWERPRVDLRMVMADALFVLCFPHRFFVFGLQHFDHDATQTYTSTNRSQHLEKSKKKKVSTFQGRSDCRSSNLIEPLSESNTSSSSIIVI